MDNYLINNLEAQSCGFELSLLESLTLLRRNLKQIIALTMVDLILAIRIVYLRYLLDNTFRSTQDVKRYLGLPILGEIHFND